MDERSLTYKTFKNISYGLVGYIWTFVFSIFITPIIVFKLGVETYGVYMVVLTVSSLMGLFDIGIGQMLVKYISEFHASGEEKRLKDLMYSFNLLLLGMSVFSLVVLSLIGFWAGSLFPSQVVSRDYYFVIFFLSGLISFIGGMTALFVSVPTALLRADISTKIGLANLTLSNLSILAVIVLGYGLKGLFLCQLFYSVLYFLVTRHYAKKILPAAELKFSWNWAEVKHAYKFGIATYISNAANSALTYFDRLLIPMFLGPAALSYYSLPGNIASKTPGVINSLSGIMFPITSSLHGLRDVEKIKQIYKRVFNLLTVVSFAIVISIALFANKMLLYWLSADFAANSARVLVILAFTYYFLSLGGTLNFFLLGMSKTGFLFKSSLVMAITNIVLLFFLLPRFGIVGAAWAYLISVLPIVFMFYYVEKRIFGFSGRAGYYFKLYLKLGVTAAVFAVLCKYIILPQVNSFRNVVIFGPLSVIIFLLLYRVFKFYEAEDMKAVESFIFLTLKRLKP